MPNAVGMADIYISILGVWEGGEGGMVVRKSTGVYLGRDPKVRPQKRLYVRGIGY